jgi:RNA polymerase sigma-70 factor (ECF subfamily)
VSAGARSVEPPDQLAVAHQLAERLATALARLPESQRTAFTLTRQNGLSIAEAAEVLGTTSMAVKLRCHRAAQALRAQLGDSDAARAGIDDDPVQGAT